MSMKKTAQRIFAGLPILVLLLFSLVIYLPASASSNTERVIHINARSFAFEPEVVHVNKGDRVVIVLESLDATHGLFLDGYNLWMEAEPGHPARLAFTADKAGTFRFRCSVACGNLHPFMIGQLKVGPNIPFWQALAALLVTTIATVWYYGKRYG